MRLYDYAASGNCYKVRLLFALLRRYYEREPVDIFAGDTMTDSFTSLNPVRETPVLEIEPGVVLTQSPAILWFLAEGTRFLPADAFHRAEVLQWLAFEQERVMSGIGGPRFRLVTGRASADDPLLASRVRLGRDALDILATHLDQHTWLVADHVTIADIAMFAYVSRAADIGLHLTASWPAVAGWAERIRELPHFVDDYVGYPPNARLGASTSIYD